MIRGPKTTMILQKSTSVSDEMGGFIKTWVDKETFSGVFVTRNAKELFLFSKDQPVSTHRFYIKKSDHYEIKSKDRLKYGTRYFEIIGITEGAMSQKSKTIIIDLLEIEE